MRNEVRALQHSAEFKEPYMSDDGPEWSNHVATYI
jgi:hypothetical protein